MNKRLHYWNGRWGRLARQDILLFEDDDRWVVEHRTGGVEGRSTSTEWSREDDARTRVQDLLAVSDNWRELP